MCIADSRLLSLVGSCQSNDMPRRREPQVYLATVRYVGFPLIESDLDVVILEEHVVERMNRLVGRLFRCEEQAATPRIIGDMRPFIRGCYQVQHLQRQWLRGLDVDADAQRRRFGAATAAIAVEAS